jgi:hypothetical protein
LYALSPERINQQRLPPSPSLPNRLDKHHRSSSDVASKVAFLNSLNSATSPSRQQSASNHAALQRAILGREEAEAALHFTNSQLAEAQIRERRISERVESLMEELQTVKERQAHERQVFEKEVRRARKDAFKAGSNLVKTQEDLKEARAESMTLKAEVDKERSAKEHAKQEAFERAYTLAGVLEEMEVTREKLRSSEAERDAVLLEQQAKLVQRQEQFGDHRHENENKQEVSEQLGEQEQQDTFLGLARNQRSGRDSPDRSPTARRRKNRFERLLPVDSPETTPLINFGNKSRSKALGNALLPVEDEEDEWLGGGEADPEDQLLDLQAELRWERTLRERADDMVHFLQMECQFKMCACRIAEQSGERFIHDWDWERKQRAESAERKQRAQSTERKQRAQSTEKKQRAQSTERKQQQAIVSVSKAAKDTCSAGEELESRRQRNKPDCGRARLEANNVAAASHLERPLSAAADFHSSAPILRPDQRSLSNRELFDLSLPKTQAARPSTAMGIMTLQSPIRVVPRSPLHSSTTPTKESRLNASASKFTSTPKSTTTRSPSASPYPITPALKTPTRLVPRTVHAQTTTTMIPVRGLEDDDVFSPASQNVPGTPISREAALAQIRARRDRARSVNLKTSICKSAPGSARRGLGGGVREFSAPGRF